MPPLPGEMSAVLLRVSGQPPFTGADRAGADGAGPGRAGAGRAGPGRAGLTAPRLAGLQALAAVSSR